LRKYINAETRKRLESLKVELDELSKEREARRQKRLVYQKEYRLAKKNGIPMREWTSSNACPDRATPGQVHPAYSKKLF